MTQITEDYVSYETAKLLKDKGFDEKCPCSYRKKLVDNKIVDEEELFVSAHLMLTNSELEDKAYKCIVYCSAPTLQMVMKWLRETHNVLVIPDYDYECTNKSYCYKIYKLGENGKPERVPIEGVRYDTLGEPHVDVVAYRDYKRSFFDYETYEEACEDGIRYCLENLI